GHRQHGACHRGHTAVARCDAACTAALLSRHGRIRPSLAADAGSAGMGALPGAVLLSHRESLTLSQKYGDPALVAIAEISDGPRGLQRRRMGDLEAVPGLSGYQRAALARSRVLRSRELQR